MYNTGDEASAHEPEHEKHNNVPAERNYDENGGHKERFLGPEPPVEYCDHDGVGQEEHEGKVVHVPSAWLRWSRRVGLPVHKKGGNGPADVDYNPPKKVKEHRGSVRGRSQHSDEFP